MKKHDETQPCHDCKKQTYRYHEYNTKAGRFYKCPACYIKSSVLEFFQPCEIYSRVVGFHTPIQRWNKGKKEEWKDRKTFIVNK